MHFSSVGGCCKVESLSSWSGSISQLDFPVPLWKVGYSYCCLLLHKVLPPGNSTDHVGEMVIPSFSSCCIVLMVADDLVI